MKTQDKNSYDEVLERLSEIIHEIDCAGVSQIRHEWPDLYYSYEKARVFLARIRPEEFPDLAVCDECKDKYPFTELEVVHDDAATLHLCELCREDYGI